MIRIGLAALFTALTLALARAEAPVTTFTLDNGMEVVVIEDHRAPVVTHMVWYRVGAADEPMGKSGIAHFLEHLMFKGTDDIPEGRFSDIIRANGGQDNAFTSQDYTGYFQRIAADRLDLVMKMEADRMTDLVITENHVTTERDVVIEERNQRTDSSPGGIFSEQRDAAQFMNHPYGLPIIGWRHEIETLGLTDAMDFYRRYYAPDNAILIVAGDVTPDEVLRLAQIHYGPKAASGRPRAERPQEPPQLSPRRLTFRDGRVRQPYVVRTYLVDSRATGGAEKAAAIRILAEALGGGATSHMADTLVREQKVAISTGAFYRSMALDQTQFGVYIVPPPNVSLDAAEAAMDAEIAAFIEKGGPDPDQLNRIKAGVRAAQIYAQDSQSSLARRYGVALTSGLTVQDVQDWPAHLEAVTAADVVAAAKDVFDINRSVTGWLMGEDE